MNASPGKPSLPWDQIETIFFDAGNTLVSIDFDWVARELAGCGIDCAPSELRRAEAAARPVVSAGLGEREEKETLDTFAFYFSRVLEQLAPAVDAGADRLAEIARELAPVLRGPGMTQKLWSWLIPGVPETLAALEGAGFQLVVVSNSDGSVEESLVAAELRGHFAHVVDSAIVGAEKPDPRIFEHALERAGAHAERTLHIGDLYSVDVVGARAAGVHPVLLDPFGDWGEVDCVCVADLPDLNDKLTAR